MTAVTYNMVASIFVLIIRVLKSKSLQQCKRTGGQEERGEERLQCNRNRQALIERQDHWTQEKQI